MTETPASPAPEASTALTRRRAVTLGATAVVAVPVLAACAGGDGEAKDFSTAPSVATGEEIAKAADVPVGGCAVFQASKIVVTQPQEGEFKAFSALCTHQGCVVSSSDSGKIPCTCHGSDFSLADGSVLKGPATKPLPAVEITVDGDVIRTV